jgi:hypothetical protein
MKALIMIFLHIFTHNWRLKLLALGLALAVFYLVRMSIHNTGSMIPGPEKGSFNDRHQTAEQ